MDVFGTPYFLLIDMQIGATWMEAPAPNDYPIKMTVDWVKVYELEKYFLEHPLRLMQRCILHAERQIKAKIFPHFIFFK